MAKSPIDALNNFVETEIEPLAVKLDKISGASSIIDWIMQKSYASTLTYQSWPDGKRHLLKDGLYEVLSVINSMYVSQLNIRCTYNQLIYSLLKQITDMYDENDTAAKAMAFDKIKAIIEELEH